MFSTTGTDGTHEFVVSREIKVTILQNCFDAHCNRQLGQGITWRHLLGAGIAGRRNGELIMLDVSLDSISSMALIIPVTHQSPSITMTDVVMAFTPQMLSTTSNFAQAWLIPSASCRTDLSPTRRIRFGMDV